MRILLTLTALLTALGATLILAALSGGEDDTFAVEELAQQTESLTSEIDDGSARKGGSAAVSHNTVTTTSPRHLARPMGPTAAQQKTRLAVGTTLAQLKDADRDNNTQCLRQAYNALRRLGAAGIPGLISALDQATEPRDRILIMNALDGVLASGQIDEKLTAQVRRAQADAARTILDSDEDEDLRINALSVILAGTEETPKDMLYDRARYDRSERLRVAALEILHRDGGSDDVQDMLAMLEGGFPSDRQTRLHVARIALQLAGKDADDAFQTRLNDALGEDRQAFIDLKRCADSR